MTRQDIFATVTLLLFVSPFMGFMIAVAFFGLGA